jgi:hypothetical protein
MRLAEALRRRSSDSTSPRLSRVYGECQNANLNPWRVFAYLRVADDEACQFWVRPPRRTRTAGSGGSIVTSRGRLAGYLREIVGDRKPRRFAGDVHVALRSDVRIRPKRGPAPRSPPPPSEPTSPSSAPASVPTAVQLLARARGRRRWLDPHTCLVLRPCRPHANSFLLAEVERLEQAVSFGFMRGRSAARRTPSNGACGSR